MMICSCCHAARNLEADLYLASVYIRVMRTTTEEITDTWLLPEMVGRVAAMLDYFLDHLAGASYPQSCLLLPLVKLVSHCVCH